MLLYDRIRGVVGQCLTWLLLLTTQSMMAHLAYAQDDFYNAVNEANEYAKELKSQRSAPTIDADGNLIHNGKILLSTDELSGKTDNSYLPADPTNTYGDDARTLMAGEDAQRTYDQKTRDTAETSGERAYHVTKNSFNRQKPDLSNDPLWSVTDDVFNNLEDIAADFANCEINTELVRNDREIHVPKYEVCTRLPAIEASFTISHDYEIGVIKHKSGPVNLSPCGNGCLDVWIGTIGDNYWPGNCTIFEESMTLEVIQPKAITYALLARSKFDDYHQVWLNDTKVWNGPNELFPPETEGACELKTSWDKTPNVDLLSFFTDLSPLSDLNLLTRTSVSGNGEGYSAIRIHYDYNKLIYNDVWMDDEKIAQAHEIKQQLDDGYCTGEIKCTDMPLLDADGCATVNGLRVCESNFVNNPMADLGISPMCREVSVRSSCEFNSGEFCTTDMQGVEHCYDNSTENRNTCVEYEQNPECSYISTTCVEGAEAGSGNCYVQEDTYDCGFTVNEGSESEEDVLRCDGQLMCVGEGCYSPDRDELNHDFAQVNVYMEIMKYAFADMTCTGIPDRPYDPNNPPEDYLPTPVCEDGYEYDPEAGECLQQITCSYSENDFYASSPRNGIQILSNNAVIADDDNILSCQPLKINGITYTCGEAKQKIATNTFYEVCQNTSTALNPDGCPSVYHQLNPITGYCEVAATLSCEESDYTLEGQHTPFDDSDDVCHAPTMSVGLTCPSDYTYSNGQCLKSLISSVQYTCPAGYALSGTTCSKTTTETQARPLYCASPYDSGAWVCRNQSLQGNTCYDYCTPENYGGNGNPQPYNTTSTASYGSCPSGWTTGSTQCSKATTTKTSATQYCSSGYTLSGNQCIRSISTSPTSVCENGYELTTNKQHCVKQPPTMDVIYTCPTQYPNFSIEDVNCKSEALGPVDGFETPATPTCLTGYSLNTEQTLCVKDGIEIEPTWSCPEFLPVFNGTTKICSIANTTQVQTDSEPLSYAVTKEVIDTFLSPFEHMVNALVPTAMADSTIPQTESQQLTQEAMQEYVSMQFYSAAIEGQQQKEMVATGQHQVLGLMTQSATATTATYSGSSTPTLYSEPAGTPGKNVSCELFKGTASECRIAVGGMQDCCENPTQISLGDYISLMSKTMQFDALTGQVFKIEGYTGVWDVASDWTADVATSAWDAVQSEFASAFDIALNESAGAAGSGGATGIGQALMSYTKDFLYDSFGPEVASMFFQNATTEAGAQIVTWSAEMAAVGNALMVVYYAYLAYVVFNLLVNMVYECEEQELDLAMKKDLYSTHYIGSYCADKILGACIEKRQVYCSFDSPLSRIVMEQVYLQPEMGLDWGTPKNPNCTGLAIDELALVNWDAVNIDEWVGLLIKTDNYTDMVNIDVESLTGSGSNLNYKEDESRQNVIERNLERAENIDADQIRRDAYEDAWDINSQPIEP